MPGVTAESPELGGDSLPSLVPLRTSSAESNFRELDDAFLQIQAKIWLGEVLQIRFDEQMHISELLADGELLFEVSEVLSRMLPTLSVDETQLKVYEWKSLASNKSTRRYMHYDNVDSFLRMCKNLGMDGIDLFTPSDVVETRNTRKVCMCLRSLSKKARLRDFNVPDFDSVTCSVAMPTDMVEGIRKSLEMSQSSSSLSVEQEAEKVSRVRYWRRMSNSASAVSSGYSDNCDEAESSFVVADTCGSSDYAYDAESPKISGSQVVGEYNLAVQLSMRDAKNEDDDQCEYLSPSKAESVGSAFSRYYSDEELSMLSSNYLGSRISGRVPELKSETKHGYRDTDVIHVPIDWEISHVVVGNCKDSNADDDEVDCVSHSKEVVDITCSHNFYPNGNGIFSEHHETLDSPSKVDCEKSLELGGAPESVVTDDFHAGVAQRSSHEYALSDSNAAQLEPFACEVGPNIGKPYFQGKADDKDLSSEFLIQSSHSIENHVSKTCAEINAERNSCCNMVNNGNATSEHKEGQLRFHEEQSACSSIDNDVHNCNCSSLLATKSNSYDDHRIPARFVAQSAQTRPLLHDVDTIITAEAFGDGMIAPNHTEQHFDNGYMDGNASNSLEMPCMDMNSSHSSKCSKRCHIAEEGSEGHDALVERVNGKPINIDDKFLVYSLTTTLCDPQAEPETPSQNSVEDTVHVNHECVKEVEKGESGVVKQEGSDKEMASQKPQRKLLKSVVKGTALIGIAVYLLHLRKIRQKNHSEVKKQPTHVVKQGLLKPSQKGQKGGSKISVYPAEKLRLGI